MIRPLHRRLYPEIASLLALLSPIVLQSQKLQSQKNAAPTTPIRIAADLSDAPRKLYHADLDLPVTAGVTGSGGTIDLITPKWIPGNHRPTGPVEDIVGVVFSADGKPLVWRRDDVDMYEFHVQVPKSVTTLHVHLDCIVTERLTQKFAVLEWEKLLLYPAHTPVADIAIQPSVKVPAGWGIGTALTPTSPYDPQHPQGGTTTYAATTVEQLEDSPVITGQYFHEFPLAPEITPKHYIDVVSDEPKDSALRPAVLAEIANLVRETDAAYASHHYYLYHFLLTLSDATEGEGLEHGQSSDNGVDEETFKNPEHQLAEADLLSHEFTHSWNGKYRRPYNLYQTDFEKAEQGSLLWVYEGGTQFLGNVMAARSGLKTQAEYRDMLAMSAAQLDNRPGREWRPTEDTAIAASILRGGDPAWFNWRRGQDYYQEGELFWLDADTLIRQKTNNRKSLDDFWKIFLGKGGNTGPLIVTYNRDELVRDLNEVMPYDWATFMHERIDQINPRADLAGIERGGYRLVYTDRPSAVEKTIREHGGSRASKLDVWYSLGLRITDTGTIADVKWNGPGDKAGLVPGMKIIAIDGKAFSVENVRAAVVASKDPATPATILAQIDELVSTHTIDYHNGPRYPHLERIEGTPALLDTITAPRTKPEVVAETKDESTDD